MNRESDGSDGDGDGNGDVGSKDLAEGGFAKEVEVGWEGMIEAASYRVRERGGG